MRIQDILAVKGTRVFTTPPDATLAEAVRHMVEHNIGAMLVCQRELTDGEKLVGIITERDLLRCFAAGKYDLTQFKVSEAMTVKLITASPSDSVNDLMGVMTTNRIRHVPILSEGRLVGMVSIGDLIKSQHDNLAVENQFMRDYIQG